MAYAQAAWADGGVFWDAVRGRGLVVSDLAAVVAASWGIALCAQLSVPLPFTPVPLTGGTLGVLYAGAMLGSRRGLAAVALYLGQGACGLPFFAGGSGLAYLLGPTGGYLAGFLAGAWIAGRLAERGWDRGFGRSLALMLCGSAAILACGLVGLARFLPIDRLLPAGLYPFLIGDAVKSCLSAGLLPLGWRWLGRRP
ncbi:MAG: biotin transporter BioY [Elusimicrobiota bacterium]|jgi:biotin transport system substrate-specific component